MTTSPSKTSASNHNLPQVVIRGKTKGMNKGTTDMKGTKEAMSHTIDATNRTIGRVASEAAHALMGKRSVHFVKNQAMPVKVVIENAEKMHLPLRRVQGKVYTSYSGHPGGFKEVRMDKYIEKKGVVETLRKTIDGMIPRNKLRTPRMKNLTINA